MSSTTEEKVSVLIDGTRITCLRRAYVSERLKGLRAFGYKSLTAKEIDTQLDLLLAGEKWTTVIGCFMEGDKPQKVTDA